MWLVLLFIYLPVFILFICKYLLTLCKLIIQGRAQTKTVQSKVQCTISNHYATAPPKGEPLGVNNNDSRTEWNPIHTSDNKIA